MALFERFRTNLAQVLRIDDTPHRLAFTFAVGVFIGMSPLIGLHVVIALILAWVFGWNRVVILSGVFVNNPWSMIPIYTFSTWIGTKLFRTNLSITEVDWDSITLGSIVGDLEQLILPFIAGCTLVGGVLALLCYVIVRRAAEGADKI